MSDMIVRNPSPGEVERAAEIASIAFPNLPLEHWQMSFDSIARVFGERYILVVESDGCLVSSMLCTPGPVYIGDGAVSHSAVGAVGTLPEYRKQGCAGLMMTESVRLLRGERICTSSLWPFSYTYYRKFGWELGAEIRNYTADSGDFPDLGDADNTRASVADDLANIMLVYDEYARGYNCLTQRTTQWWQEFAWAKLWLQAGPESQWGCIVHESDGVLDGYAVYQVGTPAEGEQVKVEVKEMVFDDPQQRWDLLAGLADRFPEAIINFGAPIDDMLIHELQDPRAIKCRVMPTHMFRVIDPPGAMQSLRGEAHVSGNLSMAISDPVFTAGFEFGMEIQNGRISLCEFDPDLALEMDVQTLAKLYTGCLTPIQAWYLGKLKVRGDMIGTLAFAGHVFSTLTPYRSWLEPG